MKMPTMDEKMDEMVPDDEGNDQSDGSAGQDEASKIDDIMAKLDELSGDYEDQTNSSSLGDMMAGQDNGQKATLIAQIRGNLNKLRKMCAKGSLSAGNAGAMGAGPN